MKAVILAGGLGSRLKPFTEIIPKPLLPIGEKSILEIQIDRLRASGFNEIILATNYKSDYIENYLGDGSRYGVKISISKETVPLGTAGPLTLLKGKFEKPFVVINGDILTSIDFNKLYDFAKNKNELLTLAIKKEILPFAFGNISFNDDYVTNVEEKPDIVTYILAGIYVMKPEIIDIIPENTYYGIDTLIKDMLKANMKIVKYEMGEYWLDIGRLNDYEEAQNIYQKHFKK
ncbi:MAG: sugar phosphate nucleotidyltransferase [Ignavibacteriae bacterium]|nr:sugar phosphate nucleotidyltransferase [Ignavibacteriota bacterium]